MVNLTGKYKFKTVASVESFVSLYIKIEFFMGGSKISHHEYASILTNGKITDFWLLQYGDIFYGSSYYFIGSLYPFRGDYSIDLSPEVKLTLIAVDGKNNIVYEREFPDYLQYSIHQSSRLSVWESIKTPDKFDDFPSIGFPGFPNYPGFCFALADFNAYVELNPDKTFSVYGIISPNSYLNLINNKSKTQGLHPSGRLYPSGYDAMDWGFYRTTGQPFGGLYYPIFSFKDNEPLVEIGEVSYTQNNNITGNSLVGHVIHYVGGGLWDGSWQKPYSVDIDESPSSRLPSTIGGDPFDPEGGFPGYAFSGGVGAGIYRSRYFPATFAHVYPNSQISTQKGFPSFDYLYVSGLVPGTTVASDYCIDINKSYPISYFWNGSAIIDESPYYNYSLTPPLYTPIIKDSKTGDMLLTKAKYPMNSTDELFLTFNGTELNTLNLQNAYYDKLRYRTQSLPGWYYSRKPSFFLYDSDIYTSDIVYDDSIDKLTIKFEKNVIAKLPEPLLGNIPETVFDEFLNKKSKNSFSKVANSTVLYSEFLNALFENYPDKNFIIPYKEHSTSFMIEYSKNIYSCLTCYSESTKTFWKYSNSVFNPDGIDW